MLDILLNIIILLSQMNISYAWYAYDYKSIVLMVLINAFIKRS